MTESSYPVGQWAATTAAWSSDSSPASSARAMAGSSPTRPATRTIWRARDGDTPTCQASHCAGEWTPAWHQRSPSSASAVSCTSRACEAWSTPATDATRACNASIAGRATSRSPSDRDGGLG